MSLYCSFLPFANGNLAGMLSPCRLQDCCIHATLVLCQAIKLAASLLKPLGQYHAALW